MLVTELMDADGNVVASDEMPITTEEHTKQTYQQKIYVENPSLWDEDHPYLYTYRAYIREGENAVDEETGTFGIRTLQLGQKAWLPRKRKGCQSAGAAASITTTA